MLLPAGAGSFFGSASFSADNQGRNLVCRSPASARSHPSRNSRRVLNLICKDTLQDHKLHFSMEK